MISVNVKKNFSNFTIDIQTEFTKGINILAGKSGSGKSSLLKMLTGFIKPDHGYINVNGRCLFDERQRINTNPERRKIGYLPQNYLLFPHMNVYENIAFGLKQNKLSTKEMAKKVELAQELCKIRHLSNRYPHDLSGGEKQRVSLARSIVLSPVMLLLDEPFSALDVHTKRYLRTEIREILTETSIPTIIVTHEPKDALSFGEQIYIMEKGKVIQRGSLKEIRTQPRSRFSAVFTGLNGYYGTSTKKERGMLHIQLDEGLELMAAGEVTGRVLVLLDPADVLLSRAGTHHVARNSFKMVVRELVNESHGKWFLVLQGSILIVAQASSETIEKLHISIGDEVDVSIKSTAIRLGEVQM